MWLSPTEERTGRSMVIDSHVHCIPFGMREEFLRGNFAAILRPFPAREIREALESLHTDMKHAGVDCSVVVTAGELDPFAEFAEAQPHTLFVAYVYDSRNPREGLRRLRKAVELHPRLIKCVKTVLPYLGQHPLQKELLPLYRYCEERKLPIQFHMGGDSRMEELSHLVYFAKICSQFPALKVVCLHAGGGQVGAIPILLRQWKNAYAELEGLQLPEAEGTREPGVLRYLMDEVGAAKLMFGSDRIFPEEKYFARVQTVQSFDHGDAEGVRWRTANAVLRLGLGIEKKTVRRRGADVTP
jgi:predicted TIM-barrel fold metal-dependent hydrolase